MNTRRIAPLQARVEPRGQVLVLFALMLVVLLLVSALAVDYGGWLVTKRNYQNVSDAAALAGAQQLTRPLSVACPTGPTKNFCARQAAWESVKVALGFTTLNAVAQAAGPGGFQTPFQENGFSVWVASPPSDAGTAYPGHVTGPGVVFVRVEHAGESYLSRIASINRTVTAWATAGRFPANFAVIAMCSPTSVTTNCLAGDANIKLDGSNTNLIIATGDIGTNRWVKTGGNSNGLALGADSNAYMQLYDQCWSSSTNQCQLWGYTSPNVDYSTTRSAIPLGAPIPDPAYAPPTINGTTAPNQCLGTGTVQLATIPGIDSGPVTALNGSPIQLAAAIAPIGPDPIILAAGFGIGGTVTAASGGALLSGITVQLINGSGSVINTTTSSGGGNPGRYSFNNIAAGSYSVRAFDGTDVYNEQTLSVTVGPDNPNVNFSLQRNPVVNGTVTNANTSAPLNNVTVTIRALGVDYTTTTNSAGFYSRSIPASGVTVSYTITGALAGFVDGTSAVNAPTTLNAIYPRNFSLAPAPASVTGVVTDKVTTLPIPNVTVTLSTGESAVTNSTGTYTIPSATPGSVTFTLTGTALDGYLPGDSASSHPTPYTTNVAVGANSGPAFNFQVWPKGCKETNAARGDWSCAFPSGNNCPATTNINGANVTCAFTQANAIRPGTYHDITVDGCAWIDPRGGATGLASGQSAGIVHVRGTLSLRSDSYLFGDGITIVMDQGSSIDVASGGGFVLNFGSVATGSPLTCDLSTIKSYNDGNTPCFRTVSPIDGQDYAYAAWTTKGHAPWACGGSQASPPVYTSESCDVQKGQELGITFYLYGSGLGNASRFKLATSNMGYLFNGALYGPNDDIQLGGGKDGQSAAGQIVGWTIEYHGGTRILQNWYGDPVVGEPFLIEPVLGE